MRIAANRAAPPLVQPFVLYQFFAMRRLGTKLELLVSDAIDAVR
jgi:hypothetical protein